VEVLKASWKKVSEKEGLNPTVSPEAMPRTVAAMKRKWNRTGVRVSMPNKTLKTVVCEAYGDLD
jgi:hypothetical protein